jgi:hypothetical protein
MLIGIVSCIYKRPKLTECFLVQLVRLKLMGAYPIIAGSEGHISEGLVKKYGIHYIECSNSPLGAKFNRVMAEMRKIYPQYVMVLGSDDFITDDYFRNALKIQGCDMAGTIDMYFYHLKTKRLGYWAGYTQETRRLGETIGLGRMLNCKLLDKCNWMPWVSGANKGLDGSMTARLKRFHPRIKRMSLAESGLFAVDIKSDMNITPFGCFEHQVQFVDRTLMNQIPEYKLL